MNLDTQLLIGIILIAVGLILALVAYYVLTQPSEEEVEQDTEEEEGLPADEAVQDADETIAHERSEDADRPPTGEETQPEERPAKLDESSAEVESAQEAAPEQAEEMEVEIEEEEPAESAATIPATPEERSFTVATLLRDELTGKLMVRVGERIYKAPNELRKSSDWTRVQFAASDLIEWVPATESERGIDREEGTAGPKSMIEQINEILQERLENAGEDQKAIRLIEAADGSVRVLIGVKSYSLDDVPDPEVGRLIREAVSAWEDLQ